MLNYPLAKKLIRENNKLCGSDAISDCSYKEHKEWLKNKIIKLQNLYLIYFLYDNLEIFKKFLAKYLKLINYM